LSRGDVACEMANTRAFPKGRRLVLLLANGGFVETESVLYILLDHSIWGMRMINVDNALVASVHDEIAVVVSLIHSLEEL
jgi:hypothetical protein